MAVSMAIAGHVISLEMLVQSRMLCWLTVNLYSLPHCRKMAASRRTTSQGCVLHIAPCQYLSCLTGHDRLAGRQVAGRLHNSSFARRMQFKLDSEDCSRGLYVGHLKEQENSSWYKDVK